MRGAGKGSRNPVELDRVNWSSLKDLVPYLMAYKKRLVLAILCLVAAKLAKNG